MINLKYPCLNDTGRCVPDVMDVVGVFLVIRTVVVLDMTVDNG